MFHSEPGEYHWVLADPYKALNELLVSCSTFLIPHRLAVEQFRHRCPTIYMISAWWTEVVPKIFSPSDH